MAADAHGTGDLRERYYDLLFALPPQPSPDSPQPKQALLLDAAQRGRSAAPGHPRPRPVAPLFDLSLAPESAPLQEAMERLLVSLCTAAEHSGAAIPAPLFVGPYPPHDFTTLLHFTPEGPIILVNFGLMMTLHKLSKLFAQGTATHGPVRHDESWPGITDELRQVLRQVYTNYWSGHVASTPRIPVLPEHPGYMAATLTNSAAAFGIGHELGHLALGHTARRSGQYLIPIASPARAVIAPFGEHEDLDADAFSAGLMLAGGAYVQVSPESDQSLYQEMYWAGCMYYLLCAWSLETVHGIWNGVRGSAPTYMHPPTQMRFDRVCSVLAARGLPCKGPLTTNLHRWLTIVTAVVAKAGPLPPGDR